MALTQEENDLLTRTDRGTPGGELIRRYWQPVALADELAKGTPLPVRLLGEDLVLFRDEAGRPGLLGVHCAHRGADLTYGRLEDGGLRCIYHGWLYDVQGRCLDQPGEPAGSRFAERIRQRAYPCHEAAGVVFAYLGPGDPPLFPNYELFQVPEDHRWVFKYYHQCNYLQGNEGNLDPTHPFFLHRFLPGSRLERTRVRISSDRVTPAFDTRVHAPTVHVEDADFGVQIYAFYDENPEWTAVRTMSFVMPNTCAVGGGPVPPGDGYLMNWHVPIDDTHHWRFSMAFRRSGAIDRAHARERGSVVDSDFRFVRNRRNRYLQDREEQRTDTYSGMGPIFVPHDSYATESAGDIQDRTQERLGAADLAVSAARRVLFRGIRAVQEGQDPPHVVRGIEDNGFPGMGVFEGRIPAGMSWEGYRQMRVEGRRVETADERR